MKRFLGISLMVGALALVAAPKAEAAFIVGTLSLSSVVAPGCVPGVPAGNTCSPVAPVAGGVVTTLGAATGLDFTTTGVATPGTAGAYDVNGASGNFAFLQLLGNGAGAIKDFTFSGAAPNASYPNVPVLLFEQGLLGGSGFSMDLLTVSIVFQTNSNLILQGTALFHLAGFDNTPGTFNFTISQTGSTFGFAASEGAVPEPGSMILLGTGLLGLATMARRMRKA